MSKSKRALQRDELARALQSAEDFSRELKHFPTPTDRQSRTHGAKQHSGKGSGPSLRYNSSSASNMEGRHEEEISRLSSKFGAAGTSTPERRGRRRSTIGDQSTNTIEQLRTQQSAYVPFQRGNKDSNSPGVPRRRSTVGSSEDLEQIRRIMAKRKKKDTQGCAPFIDDHMSEILPFLFLGNEKAALRQKLLIERGITAVLNATKILPHRHPLKFQYLRVSVMDRLGEQISDHFEKAHAFIEKHRLGGGKILVHCAQGISRSATLVASYLVRHERMTLKAALKHLRARRPVTHPNSDFMRQLCEHEKSVLGLNSLTPPPLVNKTKHRSAPLHPSKSSSEKYLVRDLADGKSSPPKTTATTCDLL